MMACSLFLATEAPGLHESAWAQDPIAGPEASTYTVNGNEKSDLNAALTSRPADPPARDASHDNSLGLRLLNNLAEDQKAIWTSPSRLRLIDLGAGLNANVLHLGMGLNELSRLT